MTESAVQNQREDLIKTILEDDQSALEEEEILHHLLKQYISKDSITEQDKSLTFAQRAADNLAKFAGSWTFIIAFFVILALWIMANSILLSKPFDIYPFILLNLILSCLASIQAPVIMMSQNRQEQKDRLRGINDYKINLKSEIIIEDIHLKLDSIINNQEDILNRLQQLESNTK